MFKRSTGVVIYLDKLEWGICICCRVIDVSVTGAVFQVEFQIIWNGLIFFDFEIDWSTNGNSIDFGDVVGVIGFGIGADWEIVGKLKILRYYYVIFM